MSPCACQGSVPVVAARLQAKLLSRVPVTLRPAAVQAAAAWLLEQTPHVALYEGLGADRPYTDLEKDLLALEIGAIVGTRCPFQQGETCLLGGIHWQPEENYQCPPYGFLPFFVLKAWARNDLQAWARDRLIADAKKAALSRNYDLDIRQRVVRT